jgi:hypothetical protein
MRQRLTAQFVRSSDCLTPKERRSIAKQEINDFNVLAQELNQDDEDQSGCPKCGSYEGDYNECPECGHGQ